MLCRACRKDLEKSQFSDEVYERAVFRAEVPLCRACSTLSKAEQKSLSRRTLFGDGPAPSVKHWNELSEAGKRARLIKNRSRCEKIVEAGLIHWKVPYEYQLPVGPFFVDFHIKPSLLAVEIDGGYHTAVEQKVKDVNRTAYLVERGWRIIRFTNKEVIEDVDRVVSRIVAARDGTQTKKNAKAKTKELMRHGSLKYQQSVPSGCVVVAKPTG